MTGTLRLVSERTGRDIGWIRYDDAGAAFSGFDAQKLFESYQHVGGWTDIETFDALATGWSNGYVTIPALT
jgi:hypothetical protein